MQRLQSQTDPFSDRTGPNPPSHQAEGIARFEQASLFGEPADPSALTLPPGQVEALERIDIDYRDDFICNDEEQTLIRAVDAADWMCDLKRRVQHYGFRYDYTKRRIGSGDRIGDLPDWITPLAERLRREGFMKRFPDQLIVNEYEPGQGIAPHIDRDCFGPEIAAVSLAGDCMISLTPKKGQSGDAMEAVVRHRSLMVYRGSGRTHYLHGIATRKSDEQEGVRIPRQRRISLTFRTLV